MIVSGKNKIVFLLVVLSIQAKIPLIAQTVWSEVNFNKQAVYVGEPMEVTISVYTSTWFTKGVDLGNIKVNGAFTTYFRPVSTSIKKQGKTYAGVQLIYNVFPYDDEDLEFPSLRIQVETPPEGGFKGEKKTLTTKVREIKVKPVPPGYDIEKWMVANGLNVTDHWSNNLQSLKVGDVLQRTIRISVDGSMAELIPPVKWDSINGVSIYPSRSDINNQRGKTGISASRTETMRFLLEKEGEVTFPEMVFSWYNPVNKKLYKRTLKLLTVNVQANPDLGVLTTIRDSLNTVQQQNATTEESHQSVFGLSPMQLLLVILVVIAMVIILVHYLSRFYKNLKEKQERYRQSEAYFFHRFITLASKGDGGLALNALYRWIDELQLKEPTINCFIEEYGDSLMLADFEAIEAKGVQKSFSIKLHSRSWKRARNNYLKGNEIKQKHIAWINPG